MPEPRNLEGRERHGLPSVTFETTDARGEPEYQRRCRAGGRRPRGVPVEVRNGLPFKPYVYRGVGYDQFTGEDDA